MADEKTGTGAAGSETAPDPITNLKGEFNRKLGNMEQQMAAMKQSTDALLASVQASQKREAPAPAANDVDAQIEKDWFDNPARAAATLTEKVTKQVTQQVASMNDETTRRSGVIAELVDQFPELKSQDHDLTKRAVEIYNSLSKEEQRSPISYKAAVSQAALEQGVAPKSKRQIQEEAEDFTLNGNGSSTVRQDRNRAKGGKLDQATSDFARLMGVNIDDEKVKERIKNNHGRKSWSRYE